MKKFLALFTVILFLSSCSDYQKALKSEDVAVKFASATKMYEAKKYGKAIRLFEQIAPAYKGKPSAEKMFYMYSQSLYKTEQYYLAGYQFESFAASYPKSEKIEEASFLGAKSFTFLSPVYSLDQTDTNKAIDKLQTYIDTYSEGQNLAEANTLVKKLREKLEMKAYENAKIYNTISDYKAAMVAFDNFMINYPGTVYKEKALFYKLDSAYSLAINSIPSKMKERLENAKTAYTSLIKYKADSQYKSKADEMLARIEKDLQQFSK
ncbi:outer membrane protein assembly factor BamD [Flavobacterium paronense]|uniref:Outer membrane protein assembly factor BamD n=1 Tax=Flavobacterium paronense TaxID=1392775 RepID=A0ABV5GGL8_9FLAO|nr:outer membrane protein assembly factor BamD [Flavobacterium paronense]MDN3675889.1 outer membrane protein assembly factor BamD [Flavobacterium paronense]MDN3677164.1 outer membrane protein assembly factor BamD [Flavobacterium paronense]